MEKFGLFDLIEKFNSPVGGKNDLSKTGNSASNIPAEEIAGTPPQLLMNKKMREFIIRHDEAVREIRQSEKERAKKKEKTAPAPAVPKKKRGRPPKSQNK